MDSILKHKWLIIFLNKISRKVVQLVIWMRLLVLQNVTIFFSTTFYNHYLRNGSRGLPLIIANISTELAWKTLSFLQVIYIFSPSFKYIYIIIKITGIKSYIAIKLDILYWTKNHRCIVWQRTIWISPNLILIKQIY